MSRENITNVAASVRQKLLNLAKGDRRPFNELLQYYAMERFLYRLSCSEFADMFILKGAMMLRIWHADEYRPTMDIDMLGRTSNDPEAIAQQIRQIINTAVQPDGLVFQPDTISCESITEDADYKGVRVRFLGALDTARIAMQLDIGFGDIVYPAPETHILPTFLNQPAPKLLCYSRESAIAEKFEAMLSLRELNSRMKDFYDIWQLSRQADFDGERLLKAIQETLIRRNTSIDLEFLAFSEAFSKNRQPHWKAFVARLKQEHVSTQFSEVLVQIRSFLLPIAEASVCNREFTGRWVAPGPWLEE
ncbi:MAG: nucleotidyl transferase AbiEii/AbiGii toxin family protein [Geobacteraceae bacterium]|nr:nucleotidyl transferase AbiEii/AbiGii toxin family protein [Geobacteraceae bacterium]